MALQTFTIPTKRYNPGTSTIAQTAVPVGKTRMRLILDTANWSDPAAILDIAMEYSQDGGVSWSSGGRAPLQCRPDGTFRSPLGVILAQVTADFSWPSGVTHARGDVNIIGAAIRTGGTVEVS